MSEEIFKSLGPWLGAMATLIASLLGLVSWSYETFEMKEVSRDRQVSLEKRLERIENKIDSLRERN